MADDVNLLSVYWGYALGGVGKYGVLLDSCQRVAPVKIRHVCIRGRNWPTDEDTFQSLEATTIWIGSRMDLSWIQELRSYIDEHAPDLIMTHGFNGHFVIQIMRILGYYRGPVVCSDHGPYHPRTWARRLVAPLINRFSEWFLRTSLATVAVAEDTKKYLVEHGVDPESIEVVHNGIPDLEVGESERARIRGEWGIPDNTVVIGVASRMEPVKGIKYLISAFVSIAENHKEAALVLVGAGTEEQELRNQVNKLGLASRVTFAGFRSDVAECLAGFDIFVLPSLSECHSIGLLEAMRAGKSIIVTDVGGNTESVVDGKEALVVPPANDLMLREALDRLLTDRVLSENLAKKARERYLAEFTEEIMFERTGAWLSNCARRIG